MDNIKLINLPSGDYCLRGFDNGIIKAYVPADGSSLSVQNRMSGDGLTETWELPTGYKYSNPLIVANATEEEASEIVECSKSYPLMWLDYKMSTKTENWFGFYDATTSLKSLCSHELPQYPNVVIVKMEKI